MTNTLNNVPREWFDRVHALLYKVAYENTPEGLEAECLGSFIPDILSAPLPAGVDGLEVAEYQERSIYGNWNRIYKLAYDKRLAAGCPEQFRTLSVTDDAQAIINGLRGEVERSKQFAAGHVLTNERISAQLHAADAERDQQAQRIAELEGLLLESLDTLESTDDPIENNVECVVEQISNAVKVEVAEVVLYATRQLSGRELIEMSAIKPGDFPYGIDAALAELPT